MWFYREDPPHRAFWPLRWDLAQMERRYPRAGVAAVLRAMRMRRGRP